MTTATKPVRWGAPEQYADLKSRQIQSEEVDEIVGKRITVVVGRGSSDGFSLAFEDGTYLRLASGGYYDGRYVEVNDDVPYDDEALLLGLMTQEQHDSRAEAKRQKEAERVAVIERRTLEELKRKYEGGAGGGA